MVVPHSGGSIGRLHCFGFTRVWPHRREHAMKRSLPLLAATMVVVAAILGATRAAGASYARGGERATTIRYRTHQVINPRPLDIARPAGPSTGDEAMEKEILYSLDGKRLGYDVLHFTVVSANIQTQTLDVIVNGAIVLKAGTINIQGETTFRTIRVGVNGGTGAYQRVLGQLTVLRTLPNGDDIDQLSYTHVD